MNILKTINFLIREVPNLQLVELHEDTIYFKNEKTNLIYKVNENYNIDLVAGFFLTTDEFSKELTKKIKYELY